MVYVHLRTKKKLISSFIEDTDFVVTKVAAESSAANKNDPSSGKNKKAVKIQGGTNKEEIFLTIDCFKSMCMISGNDMGKKVRRYYLFVEKVLKGLIERSVQELTSINNSLKLEKEKLSLEVRRVTNQKNMLLKKKRYHEFERGPVFYIISDGDQMDCSKTCKRPIRYKVGVDNKSINLRLQQYRTSIPHTRLDFLMYTKDNSLVEKCVLTRFRKNLSPHLNHEWISLPLDKIVSFIEEIVRTLDIDCRVIKDLEDYNRMVKMDKVDGESEYTEIIFVD